MATSFTLLVGCGGNDSTNSSDDAESDQENQQEDYLRGSDIGEIWAEIVKDCILEINIIEEE